MNELHKKVLLDLCVTPATALPIIGGVSLLMLSLVLGSGLGFIGFSMCLFGLGVLATNLIFGYEKAVVAALKQQEEKKQQDRERYLDALDLKLASDRDPRDQEALRNLRAIYASFKEDLKAGKVSVPAGGSMSDQMDAIFDQCVKQLEKQHEVWLSSRKVNGDLKNKLLKQKSDILDEVEASVRGLADVINDVRGFGLKVEHGELAKLQERLMCQLSAAKATAEIVAGAEAGADLSRFAEYDKR